MKYRVTAGTHTYEIEIEHGQLVRVDGCPLYVGLEQVGGLPLYSLATGDDGYLVFVEKLQSEYRVEVQGHTYPVNVERVQSRPVPPLTDCESNGGEQISICAPLAGHLISLPVAVGASIEAGRVVAVVESMKMKMELRAPQAAIVENVHGAPDRDVSQGEELVTLRCA
jgi:biotin carboxyl carrier protein